MSHDARTVAEHRVAGHLRRLDDVVNTTDALRVLTTAADALDALYSLTRLWRGGLLSEQAYDDACRDAGTGRAVGGLTYLRGRAVHQAVVLSDFTDRVAEYFYDHYGCWVWRQVSDIGATELAVMYRDSVAGAEVRVTTEQVRQFLLEDLPARLEP
jgi:hypothetical protein